MESKNIVPEAYSPLGSTDSPLLHDEEILAIAKKYNVGVGTILISYQIARNVVVLPKSVTDKRIIDNLLYIKLDDEDMKVLNGLWLTKGKRFIKVSPISLRSKAKILTYLSMIFFSLIGEWILNSKIGPYRALKP